MKPIIKREHEKTISTSEITENHIVVTIINNLPYIYCKGIHNEHKGFSSFYYNLNDEGYEHNNDSLEIKIESMMNRTDKIEVFHKDNWKDALKWLIDNA